MNKIKTYGGEKCTHTKHKIIKMCVNINLRIKKITEAAYTSVFASSNTLRPHLWGNIFDSRRKRSTSR